MEETKQAPRLLRQLRQVFKDGYRPARGNESYLPTVDQGGVLYNAVNCFGHSVFNLRNQQFSDYQLLPCRLYNFPNIGFANTPDATQRMFNFIQDAGLEVDRCDPAKNITDFKSWKVALYFENTQYLRDIHYMLEEGPQQWSSKIGFQPFVDRFNSPTPPKTYYTQIQGCTRNYQLYGTYQITNPYATPKNHYVQATVTPDRSL